MGGGRGGGEGGFMLVSARLAEKRPMDHVINYNSGLETRVVL